MLGTTVVVHDKLYIIGKFKMHVHGPIFQGKLILQFELGLGMFRLFLKTFHSVLEQGPSAKSFRSRSFFYCSVLVPFRPVSFRSEKKNSHPDPFRSWHSYLKIRVPSLSFCSQSKNVSIPRSVLSKEQFHPRQKFYRKGLVKSKKNMILK